MSSTGTVKSFNALKGFGFITASDGKDHFVHIKHCNTSETGGVPVQGDQVTFDLGDDEKSPGRQHAVNVSGGTGAPPKRGGGAFQGTCKSLSDKGYGFIYASDGKELFFHIKSVTDGSTPQAGDNLSYDLEESRNKPGEMQAANVTGGTGKGKGKGGKGGKDGGKGGDSWGGDGGWGAAKGGDSWSSGPYGGGKGGGDSWGGQGGDSWSGKGGDSWGGQQQGGDNWGGKGGGGGDSWGGQQQQGGDNWGGKGQGGGDSWGGQQQGGDNWGGKGW